MTMKPYQVEQYLKITRAERLRWQQDGRLPIAGYADKRLYGDVVEVPYFSDMAIMQRAHLVPEWRAQDKEARRAARSQATKLATGKINASKARLQSLRAQILADIEAARALPDSIRAESLAVLRLAFWTVLISRWAKYHQVRSRRKKLRARGAAWAQREADRARAIYQAKNRAIAVLQRSQFVGLSFYRPQWPDRIDVVLCWQHETFRREWNQALCRSDYMNPLAYYRFAKDAVEACGDCGIQRERDHYSLYHTVVCVPQLPTLRFSFHTPFPVGRDFLPAPDGLPLAAEHREQEGVFRFGRPVTDEEAQLWPELRVMREHAQALAEADLVLPAPVLVPLAPEQLSLLEEHQVVEEAAA
jgi:hypothetical protein